MKKISARISLTAVLLCASVVCRKQTAAGVSEAKVTTPAKAGFKIRSLNHSATKVPRISESAHTKSNAAVLGGPVEVGIDSSTGATVLLDLMGEFDRTWHCQNVEAFKQRLPKELALLACHGGEDEDAAKLRAATSFRCGIHSCPASIVFQRTGGALRVELGSSLRQGSSADSQTGSTAPDSGGISLRVYVQRPRLDAIENCVAFDQMLGWGIYVEEARQAVDQICGASTTPRP